MKHCWRRGSFSPPSPLLALSCAVAVALAACAPGLGAGPAARSDSAAPPPTPKRIAVAIIGDPVVVFPGVDLRQASASEEIEDLLNSGLVSVDQIRTVRPQLAESVPSTENGMWRVSSDGRMQTTWKIRSGAQWHDGRPVTADDLVFTLQVTRDKDFPSFGNVALDAVDSIEAADPSTVTVHWKQPYIQADQLFSGRVAMPMPRHLLEGAYTSNKEGFLNLPYWRDEHVGSGPFQLRQFIQGSHLVAQAFDQYVLGRPKLDEVEVRFIRDQTTLAANLLAGAVDATMGRGLSVDQAVQIRDQWRNGGIAPLNLQSWVRIHPQFVNPAPAIVGTELAFREGLLAAVDRQEIVDTVQHGLVPIADMLPAPTAPEYRQLESSFVRHPYDTRVAGERLGRLGYPKGLDGIFVAPDGQKLSVELRTTADNDARRKALLIVADFWQRAGVAVEPVIVAEQLQGDRQYRAEFPAFEIKRGSSDLGELPRFHSRSARLPSNNYRGAGGTNDPRYMNPGLDGLIDRYVATVPMGPRLEVAGQIINHVTGQLVMMGLYFDPEPAMVTQRLKNFAGEAWNAHEWEIAG